MISFLLGPVVHRRLRAKQIGELIRDDGPQTHKKKAGTPTMGGALILFALVDPDAAVVRPAQPLVWLALLVTVGYGAIGFVDDYLKLDAQQEGPARQARSCRRSSCIAGAAVAYLFYSATSTTPDLKLRLALPFVDFYKHPLALWLAGVHRRSARLVVVGTSNAVNLTDGLDGLAIGPVDHQRRHVPDSRVRRRHACIKGFNIAEYLEIPYIPGAGELAIFCGALAGAGIGFLWFNTYPAQVFMGDVGALALGGALGMLAVSDQERARAA